ncbi:MAG: terminase small subunit [Desulfobulbia bacterium]
MLTAPNKRFVQEYVATGDQTASYLVAYPRSRAWKSRREVTKAAWKLLRKPEVKAYYDQLMERFEQKAVLSLEEHMKELERLREQAKEAKHFSAAIKAEYNRGKLMGFYTNKTETQNSDTIFVINADAIDREEDPEEWAERMRPKSIESAE